MIPADFFGWAAAEDPNATLAKTALHDDWRAGRKCIKLIRLLRGITPGAARPGLWRSW